MTFFCYFSTIMLRITKGALRGRRFATSIQKHGVELVTVNQALLLIISTQTFLFPRFYACVSTMGERV